MAHSDTPVPEPDAGSSCRALVATQAPEPAHAVPARPLAPFLVQLIDGETGVLRPSRRDRSRVASARYAAGGPPTDPG